MHKIYRPLFWIAYASILLFVLLITVSSRVPSRIFWFAPEFGWILPFALLLAIGGCILLIVRKKYVLLVPYAVLTLVNYSVPKQLIAFHSVQEQTDEESIKILSFNSSFFHSRTDFSKEYEDPRHNMKAVKLLHWLKKQSADIICLQEFYHDEKSALYNSIGKIGREGLYEHSFVTNPRIQNGRLRGMIIFSKFPIVNEGELFLEENRYNGAMYVDVLKGADTLRVVNVHLQSSELYTVRRRQQGMNFFKNIAYKVKQTALKRQEQVEKILDFAQSVPYESVIVGDFNESPYSYLYRILDKEYENAFVNAGKGFGLTYNSNLLWLRIDNQFYSEGLEAIGFRKCKEIDFSDHFPIEGVYKLNPK